MRGVGRKRNSVTPEAFLLGIGLPGRRRRPSAGMAVLGWGAWWAGRRSGPSPPRSERGGVADAGVVLFPLTPSLLLAMFDDARARPQKPYELSYADLADINREIVGASSAYAFERPSRKTAAALKVPKAGEPLSGVRIDCILLLPIR
jgi:hypothetical protein